MKGGELYMAVKGKNVTVKANIRNAQNGGKGIAGAAKGGANYKNSQGKGGGLTQKGVAAKIAKPAARGTNKLNKAPIVAKPKTVAPAKQARNSVTKGDVSRMRAAQGHAMPKLGSGGFKNFIGGK